MIRLILLSLTALRNLPELPLTSSILTTKLLGTHATPQDAKDAEETHEGSKTNLIVWGWGKLRWLIKKRKEFYRRHRKGIVIANIVLVLLVILGMVIGMHIYAPDTTKYHERSPVLFDNQGEVLYSAMSKGDYHRIHTTVHDVDPLYLKMLLAAEDQRFYHHIGVDSFAIVRAMLSNVQAGTVVSGASTITMQVCRLLEPKERSIFNKVKEALGAIYLTFYMGREEVLNMYLTLSPFGGNIEGVTAASYMYFGHGPQYLTPDEAALLVALPRAPEAMRPDLHPERAKYYRHQVLQKAYEEGIIAADVMELADKEPLPTHRQKLPQTAYHLGQSLFSGKLQTTEGARYYPTLAVTLDAHTNTLERKQTTELYTTIDPEVQQVLNTAARDYLTELTERTTHAQTDRAAAHEDDSSGESIALIAVDNESFKVLGYVGSPDLSRSYVDAVQALRSPGSALKPFAYAMAFEEGLLHPNSLLLDQARIFGSYQPCNYDRKFFGEMTAALALQASINLPALEVMQAIGPTNFINRINQFANAKDQTNHQGESESYTHGKLHLAKNTEPHLGIILGAADISLYDLTQLYAALAHDGGIRPLTVLRAPQGRATAASVSVPAATAAPAAADAATATTKASSATSPAPVNSDLAAAMDSLGDSTPQSGPTANKAQEAAAPALSNPTPEAAAEELRFGTFLRADAARATYQILEGTPAPMGFKPSEPISYKTGTSYKYRDAIAVGSRGGITVGIWTGRLDGGAREAYSAYETVAPVLFKVMANLKDYPIKKPQLEDSPLLRPTPPQALARVATSSLGKTHKRESTEPEASTIPQLGAMGSTSSTANDAPATTGTSGFSESLKINFPPDGGRLQVGYSGQILLSFSGGQSPYFVLINDEIQEHSTYFTPKTNGFYNITIIDSRGNSVTHQVLVSGLPESSPEADTLEPAPTTEQP